MNVTHSPEENKFLDVIENLAKHNDFVDYKVTFGKNTSGVEGYISRITEVKLVSNNKELNLVIKCVGSSDKIRTILPIESIMKREIYMYETIFPLFQQFEVERMLQPSKLTPTYYMSHKNDQYHALLLRNLKNDGFSIYDSKSFFNDSHVKLTIKQYAQLHAVCLAYKDQNASKFKALVESMDDFYLDLYKKNDVIKLFAKQMQKAAKTLDSNEDVRIRKVYESFISEIETFILGLHSEVDEYSVIIHGDCWKNNMMFKYEDRSNPLTPTDVRLIDFQFSRLANPMLDIANFIYGCSSRDVIDNIQQYLELYYENLSNRLQDLGSDPETLYPFSVLMEHWKKFARMGLIIRPACVSLLFGKENERISFSDALELDGSLVDMFDYEIEDMELYNDISRHTIVHFVENNLI